MVDETKVGWLGAEIIQEDADSQAQVAAIYAEAIHQTHEFFPLQFANFYGEVMHQTHDVYATHFGFLTAEVMRSMYDAAFPPFLDAPADDSEIFAPTIPTGVPKFSIKNVERNPYAAHVPATAEETQEFNEEQQKILRDQHNKTQAGDTTFDWGLLLKPYPTKEYTLGSLGRFYHPDFGMILARFCQMTDFIESSFQGQPVGRRRSVKNTTVDWLVTNDYDKSGPDLAMGLVFFATKPDDLTYGWVVVNGANPSVIQNISADKPSQAQGFGWAESNRLSPDASGPTLLRVWGNSPLGRIEAGFGFIEVERWSLQAMRALIVAETQATVDGLAQLSTRVNGVEAQGKSNASSIKAANDVIATLKKALDREILTRQRQIDALRASATGNENDPNVQLRQDLEKRIADGDRTLDSKIGAHERAIVALQKAIEGLDVASITEQLKNLSNAQGFLSRQYADLLQPTTKGMTLVSAVVATNEDGSDRLGFIQVNFKLSNLYDVDTVTTPPEDGQALIWDLASEKWIPGDVATGGGGGGGPTSTLKMFAPPKASDFMTIAGSGVSITLADADVGLAALISNASSGVHNVMAFRPVSSPVFFAQMRVSFKSRYQRPIQVGLGVRNSANDRIYSIANVYLDRYTPVIEVDRWNNLNSYSGTAVSSQGFGDTTWFRIESDGTIVKFMYSANGLQWYTLYEENVGSFLGAIDQVGLFCDNESDFPLTALIDWYSDSTRAPRYLEAGVNIRQWDFDPPKAAYFPLVTASGGGTFTVVDDDDVGLRLRTDWAGAATFARDKAIVTPTNSWSVRAKIRPTIPVRDARNCSIVVGNAAHNMFAFWGWDGRGSGLHGMRYGTGGYGGWEWFNDVSTLRQGWLGLDYDAPSGNLSYMTSGDGKEWATVLVDNYDGRFGSKPSFLGVGIAPEGGGAYPITALSVAYWKDTCS